MLLISAASMILNAPSPLRATRNSSFMTLQGLRPKTRVSWRKFKRSLRSAQCPLNQMISFMPFGQLYISFIIFSCLSATAGSVLDQIYPSHYWSRRRGSLMSNGQETVFSSSSSSPYLPLMEIQHCSTSDCNIHKIRWLDHTGLQATFNKGSKPSGCTQVIGR